MFYFLVVFCFNDMFVLGAVLFFFPFFFFCFGGGGGGVTTLPGAIPLEGLKEKKHNEAVSSVFKAPSLPRGIASSTLALAQAVCVYSHMRRKDEGGRWEPYHLTPQWIKLFGDQGVEVRHNPDVGEAQKQAGTVEHQPNTIKNMFPFF